MADEVTGGEVPSCDDELDELLDSALSDFDKPPTPSVKKLTDQSETSEHATPKDTTTKTTEENSTSNEDELSKIFAASFAEAAGDLETAMKNMGGDRDVDFMEHLKQLTDSAKEAASKEHPGAMGAFEENLAKTMSEMTQNTKDLENCGSDPFGEDMFKAMSSMGLEGGGDFDMMPLMQGMMKNLLSKEILYPSLKELNDKYPEWLENNKSSHSNEEQTRFTKQYQLVSNICQEYESENSNDSDEMSKKRFERIMELMQKMQECGQPPEELVGQVPHGGAFGSAMPGMPGLPGDLQEQCKVS